jgi:hypothetical protein
MLYFVLSSATLKHKAPLYNTSIYPCVIDTRYGRKSTLWPKVYATAERTSLRPKELVYATAEGQERTLKEYDK